VIVTGYTHRQVDAHRAGGGAAQLADGARQPRHHISRIDLIARMRSSSRRQQVTEFRDGILPWLTA